MNFLANYFSERYYTDDYFYNEIEDCNCVRKIPKGNEKKSQTNETVIEHERGMNKSHGLHLNKLISIKYCSKIILKGLNF